MEQQSEKYQEGMIARTIENQTAKMPSDIYLWAAFVAMDISLALKCLGRAR